MADTSVTIPSDLAAELDALASVVERSPTELAAEAIARYVLEERLAVDRVVAARLGEVAAAYGDGWPDQPPARESAACGP
jgi:predicted transcriptional regulator